MEKRVVMKHGMTTRLGQTRWIAAWSLSLLLCSFALAKPQGRTDGQEGSGSAGPASNVVQLVPAHRQANEIAILTIEGEIDLMTQQSLERRIEEATADGYTAIVLEINTPGGRVDAARNIVNLIKNDAPVNTVAWVNPDAFSAGTLIAISCKEVVVHPNATWGDVAPIGFDLTGLQQMHPAERAKMEAPLRADMRDAARRYGYDEKLVESFVAVGIELWMLENARTNERIFVDRAEYLALYGEEPPQQITAATPPASGTAPFTVRPFYDPTAPLLDDDKTDEERAAEQEREIERAQTLRSTRPDVARLDPTEWNLLKQIVSSDQLLTLKAGESIEYGLATAVIRNDQELCAFFGTANLDPAKDVRRYDESWSEQLVRFLVSFWVRVFLGAVFIIALFLELAAPGMGVFGAVAGLALLVLIGAPYVAGLADVWEIVLILVGMALLAVEIFVIPGFGVAGVAGILCMFVGVIGSFVSGSVTSEEGQAELLTGIGAVVASLFGAGVGVWLMSRYIYDIPVFKKVILSATTDSASSAIERDGVSHAVTASPAAAVIRPGDTGVAETSLRPAGRATINGRLYDVVTAGEWIESGAMVRVRRVDPFRIEVERRS